MGKIGIVFPGQGIQHIGMGKDLYENFAAARNTFDEASEILHCNISRMCFEGPRDALDLTTNTQICIFTATIAAYRVFEKESSAIPEVMAGHSLGECSALFAAEAFDFADMLMLVRARGLYHQNAVPPGSGCMAAIIGLTSRTVAAICKESRIPNRYVGIANINSPTQIVISGHREAVHDSIGKAKQCGARTVILPISVPCHCTLLQKAAQAFDKKLASFAIRDCRIAVIPNSDPDTSHSAAATRNLLVRQITSPVQWLRTIKRMISMGIDTIVEVGPKKNLSSLTKRISATVMPLNVEDTVSLKQTLDFLRNH